ncbi:MAG: hypothetical protein AB1458_08190 [Bacteroidota bacterium]
MELTDFLTKWNISDPGIIRDLKTLIASHEGTARPGARNDRHFSGPKHPPLNTAEDLADRAASCKCGAWTFAKNGRVVHTADCRCCG